MKKEADIKQRIADIIHRQAPTAHAWLYGSRARGDNRPDSDWDILILLDKESVTLDDEEKVSYPLYSLGIDTNTLISPALYTTKDWEWRRYTPFYESVMQDRKQLV